MEQGVVMSIGSDAHNPSQINFLKMGVSVSRRGWLEGKDLANTLGAKEILKLRR
jgi:DNA polymerase (family 10)